MISLALLALTISPAPSAVALAGAQAVELHLRETHGSHGSYGAWALADDGRGTPFVVEKKDNICGLDEPRQLTKPAAVDYQTLLDATPELKKIEKDGIDPKSSQGITLMTKARSRVLKACESVRQSGGYCSVWKKIKRRDKKAIPDVTDSVKRLL